MVDFAKKLQEKKDTELDVNKMTDILVRLNNIKGSCNFLYQ